MYWVLSIDEPGSLIEFYYLACIYAGTVIDMTSIDRSKYFFQLIEKNIMSIAMSINRNTFFQPFTPFLANYKNFEEKLLSIQSKSVEKTFIVFALGLVLTWYF